MESRTMQKQRNKITRKKLRPLLIKGSIAAAQVLAILAVTVGNTFLMISVSIGLLTRTGQNILFAILPIPLYGFVTVLIAEGILSIRGQRLTNRIEGIVDETLRFPRREHQNET
jgi:hypothetical protein